MSNTVLILEDNKELMESYLEIIESFTDSYPVACSTVVEVFTRKDSVLKTNVAFLDLNLATPKESGLDVAHWLRKNNYTGKIYFLTGQVAHLQLNDEISKLDAKILHKPFDMEEFIQIANDGSSDQDRNSTHL